MKQSIQPEFKPVYIIGAGVSSMLGAPLLAEFMQKAKEIRWARDFPISLKDPFDDAFRYQEDLSTTKNYMAPDLDNLEVLFSLVDMDYQIVSVEKEEASVVKLTNLRNDFITLVIETLNQSIKHSGDGWNLYKSLIRCMSAFPTSCFVTFNYDLALERALEAAGAYVVRYGLDRNDVVSNTNERFVLKLHGSADWAFCSECKKLTVFKKYVTPREIKARSGEMQHIDGCSKNSEVLNVLIPPTWQKLNYVDQITNVWYHAIREISLATHIFVIGYSFPRTDVFFDQLLALGLSRTRNLKRLVIVNPSIVIEKLIGDLFDAHFRRKKVLYVPRKFEELLRWITVSIDSSKDMTHLIKIIEEGIRKN